MRVKLTSVDPWADQIRLVVEKLPAIVGRSLDADACVEDQWVSRFHCELYDMKGTLAVRDLDSKHGTFVNGLRVQETLVLPGNRLSLGMTTLKVEYKRQTPKASPRAESQTETIQAQGETISEFPKEDAGQRAPIESVTPLPGGW
jgi:pSer/pThr/pTyr-binding forkhead associated (FHA) protein